MVKAGISQFQRQGVLQVDVAMDGVGGLAIRQALDVLEEGDQGQSGRRIRRLAAGGEEIGELVVSVERSEFIDGPKAVGTLGRGRAGYTQSLWGDDRFRWVHVSF